MARGAFRTNRAAATLEEIKTNEYAANCDARTLGRTHMADDRILRREFLKGAAIAGTAAATAITPAAEAAAQSAAPKPAAAAAPDSDAMLTLTPAEQAFFSAAADTIIPADDLSPSGSDCGVVVFIDRQLAGAYGSGARLYRQGPFLKAKPELGYQLELNPREFFRAGITAANEFCRKTYGKDFDRLSEQDRDAALKTIDQGKANFSGFGSAMFFNALLQITMEGFFADPMYGGNRDMAAWKMVGYPGLPATYREDIKAYFNKKYDKPPRSIADFS
jgi:gluconate 2-dehydrogenase gamma chain